MALWRVLDLYKCAASRRRSSTRLNLTESTKITENGSVTKAVFAANPLGESPLFFVYGIFRFCPYFEVRIFALSFRIRLLYSRHNCYYEKCGKSNHICIDDEVGEIELPNGWMLCRLSSVADIYTGNSINENEKQKNYTGLSSGYNYIGTKDVGFDHSINYQNGVKIPFDQPSFRIAHKNTPLLCIEGGSAGRKIGILQEDVCFGNKLCAFESFGINPKYIYYYLQNPSFTQVFKEKTTGIIGGVSVNTLKSLLFLLPPLAEQERIVAEIEKFEPLIAEYDKLEQQATKLDSEIYDKLKKSILQYAIQGKLVPQDQNDEPASVLLEHIRAEKKAQLGKKYIESYIFKGDDNCYYEKVGSTTKNITDEIPFDIPDSWSWARIDEIFQHNTGKALNSSNTKGSLKNYITTSNLYWGHFKLDSLKQMLFTDDEVEKCSIHRGDLLVCEGGDIGRAAIWNYDIPMCIQNHIHRLRAFSYVEIQLYYYVFYLYKQLGIIGGKGIGIQGLSTKALGKIIIPIPPLNEQRRILNKISIIFDNIKGEI